MSFLPSSVNRSDAARRGSVPGVIFAINELSSARGGAGRSGMLPVSEGSSAPRSRAGGVGGPFVFKSCSLILDSWGSGFFAGSCAGGGAGGGQGSGRLADGGDVIGARYTERGGAQPCKAPPIKAAAKTASVSSV